MVPVGGRRLSNTPYDPAGIDLSRFLCVSAPAAQLRKEPFEGKEGTPDDLQESQLLANELFLPSHEEREWYFGQAVEQPYHTQEGWIGYPGWVKKDDLATISMTEQPNAVIVSRDASVFSQRGCTHTPLLALPLGSRVRAEPQRGSDWPSCKVHLYSGIAGWVLRDRLRFIDRPAPAFLSEAVIREVVNNTFLFIGVPYGWGGMGVSPADTPDPSSPIVPGLDCSALVCLSYRLSGIDVPRNGRDQWLWAQPIQRRCVKAGDLVFIAREDAPKAIRHVMICTGQESLVEASETGRSVSETTFSEKFGQSYRELKQAGLTVPGKRIYLGRITKGLEPQILHRPCGRQPGSMTKTETERHT